MTSFEVPGRYDVILCLFSAIGYVRTLENVLAALRRMRAHRAPGGVVRQGHLHRARRRTWTST